MENRKPFQLRKLLIVYNAIQTVFSAWIFYEVSLPTNNSWLATCAFCQSVNIILLNYYVIGIQWYINYNANVCLCYSCPRIVSFLESYPPDALAN